jgi:hypothetical protein
MVLRDTLVPSVQAMLAVFEDSILSISFHPAEVGQRSGLTEHTETEGEEVAARKRGEQRFFVRQCDSLPLSAFVR